MGKQSYSDYIKAWKEMFIQVMPTDILLYSENGLFLDFIAAWNIVTSLMINSEDERIYKRIIFVMPISEIDYTDKIKAFVNQLLDREALPEARKLEIINGLEFIYVPTIQAEDLLEQIKQIPNGAAIGILYSSFYRFANIDNGEKNDSRFRTWMGMNIRANTAEELYAAHLIELVNELLIISQEKNAFITLFCQYNEYLPQKVLKTFENNDSVMHVEGAIVSNKYVDLEAFQKLAVQVGTKPIEELLNAIPSLSSDPVKMAIMATHLYFRNQQFLSAWQSIEPVLKEIFGSNNSALILSISDVAFSAGKVNDGIELLNKAIHIGLIRLEDLHHAYLLAEKSDLKGLGDDLFIKIRNLYPDNRLTKNMHIRRLMDEEKYSEALPLSKELDNEFGQILCETFGKEILNLEKFIEYGKESNQLDRVLVVSANEAIRRNLPEIAEHLINQVSPDSEYVDDFVKLKIDLWIKRFPSSSELDDEFVHELDPIISLAARNPNKLDYRFALERLFQQEIEGPTSLAILSVLLLNRIHESFVSINFRNISDKWESQKVSFPSRDEINNEVIPLFKTIFESIKQIYIVIGHGELNPALSKALNENFIGGVLRIIQEKMISGNPEFDSVIYPLLHVLSLACKYIGDPNTDLLAARLIISGLNLNGLSQQARDLAETSFVIAANQPEYIDWRNGQAWSGYADAFHRSGNPLLALLNLTLSFYSWDGEALNYELLIRSIRLTARILRDMMLLPPAKDMIRLEKDLLMFKMENQTELLELEQMKLSIELLEQYFSATTEQLENLLSQGNELIDKSIELKHEFMPILSIQASIIRLIIINGGAVSEKAREKFNSLLDGLDNPNVNLFRAVANPFPSKDDLSSALKKASNSNHLDDLVHQLHPVMIIAENAIQSACQTNDLDLFLLASTVLSQPGLAINSVFSNDQSYESTLHFTELAKSWLVSNMQIPTEDININDTRVMEARQLVNQFLPEPDSFFNEIASLSYVEIRKILRDEEILVVLAENALGRLCRLIISTKNSEGPNVLPKETWTKEKFSIWQKQYPANYGLWRPIEQQGQIEILARSDVLQSVKNLSIGEIPSIESKSIIICPTSNLFSFPFVLSLAGEKHISESNRVSVIPSATFLVQSRKKDYSNNRPIKAWLGAPETFDENLLHVRDELIPVFAQYGIEIVESEFPDPLAEASIGIVLSHGDTGLLNHFTGVTDHIRFFSAKDFADRLAGCNCVILFVCSAARADTETASTEVRGLTRELLYRNTKAVIASPWSLNIDVPQVWLPPFLEYIHSNHSIGFSSFMASQIVKAHFDNPCAWAALQVYGDPEFTPFVVPHKKLEEK